MEVGNGRQTLDTPKPELWGSPFGWSYQRKGPCTKACSQGEQSVACAHPKQQQKPGEPVPNPAFRNRGVADPRTPSELLCPCLCLSSCCSRCLSRGGDVSRHRRSRGCDPLLNYHPQKNFGKNEFLENFQLPLNSVKQQCQGFRPWPWPHGSSCHYAGAHECQGSHPKQRGKSHASRCHGAMCHVQG